MKVISLYDYTGEALRPWLALGYECHAYDIQHDGDELVDGIHYHHADLHDFETLVSIINEHEDACFGLAFPVCTDLAVSGARHFEAKRKKDPLFQDRACLHARQCAWVFEQIGCPYLVENPISVLATLWRKPDYRFDPYEFGGYVPEAEAAHPRWPDYIPERDAYPKRTCLWTGNGFVMPEPRCVPKPDGHALTHLKLGGTSKKTKNIRSATPRGFARAVALANTTQTADQRERRA